MAAEAKIPNVLTIAGVDPSGGAGVLADVKAISALSAYACAVVAALTAQNTRAVTGIFAVPPSFVREQIDTLFADVRIDAAKIGMVGQAPVIREVADRIAHWQPPHVVLDPVMIAKSGDALLEKAAVGAMLEGLLLGAMLAISSFNGTLLVGSYAVAQVVILAAERGRGFGAWFISRSVAAVIVLLLLGLTLGLGMVQSTPNAFLIGWNRFFLRGPWTLSLIHI